MLNDRQQPVAHSGLFLISLKWKRLFQLPSYLSELILAYGGKKQQCGDAVDVRLLWQMNARPTRSTDTINPVQFLSRPFMLIHVHGSQRTRPTVNCETVERDRLRNIANCTWNWKWNRVLACKRGLSHHALLSHPYGGSQCQDTTFNCL